MSKKHSTDARKSLIYLAVPYGNDPDLAITVSDRLAAQLFNAERYVFSPICHYHHMAQKHEMPRGYAFWRDYNLHMLNLCDELWVICLPGWRSAKGVQDECDYAGEIAVPIRYVSPAGSLQAIASPNPDSVE
ncbi:MAG: DUF1937 family protein [Cyanobacteria bacterium P01_H01_bin.121]